LTDIDAVQENVCSEGGIILSLAGKFLDKPVGGKIRSSEGEVPWLPPYKYHPAGE